MNRFYKIVIGSVYLFNLYIVVSLHTLQNYEINHILLLKANLNEVGVHVRGQPFQCEDRRKTSDSEVYRRQILTSKVNTRAERVKYL